MNRDEVRVPRAEEAEFRRKLEREGTHEWVSSRIDGDEIVFVVVEREPRVEIR